RYELTDNGISPRLYPGQSQHLVVADSDEHDEKGHITEDLSETAVAMAQKRQRKFKSLQKEMKPPEVIALDEGETVFIGWGSSRQAIIEAVDLLKQDGVKLGMIHFTELWPLPDFAFPEGKKYWSVECNATAQLARLLRSEYGLAFEGTISRYDGLPLTGQYIRSRFNDH
ncbi:MAG: 2-oxoacid:acceptor oxidoreductase subunit alpha, partial [Deltaproteobacteria bacterium]|nr:2-oxoacid:acceptor oxidoreductase subunit alpha [Deltaproteobacteria bacterium]